MYSLQPLVDCKLRRKMEHFVDVLQISDGMLKDIWWDTSSTVYTRIVTIMTTFDNQYSFRSDTLHLHDLFVAILSVGAQGSYCSSILLQLHYQNVNHPPLPSTESHLSSHSLLCYLASYWEKPTWNAFYLLQHWTLQQFLVSEQLVYICILCMILWLYACWAFLLC